MQIMINEPDGRVSGIMLGETVGVDYGIYFTFNELNGRSGKESETMLQEALEGIDDEQKNEYERQIREKMRNILKSLLELAERYPEGTWRVS